MKPGWNGYGDRTATSQPQLDPPARPRSKRWEDAEKVLGQKDIVNT